MNLESFKEVIIKSGNRMFLVGLLPFLMGAGMLAGAATSGGTALWVIGGIFTAIGFLMFFIGVKSNSQVKNNTHPIVKAIIEKDTSFVAWFYDKRIKSQVEGIQVGQSSNLVVIYKNGKGTEIILGKGKNIEPLMEFLSNHFPSAEVGYSDDSRAKMSQLLGKKY